jgi:hypothetical protein
MNPSFIPVLVAVLALLGVAVNAGVTLVQGRKVRDQAADLAKASGRQAEEIAARVDARETATDARRDWWERVNDTIDRLYGSDEAGRNVALVILEGLTESKWAQDEDKALLVRVLAAYNEAALAEASFEPARGGARLVDPGIQHQGGPTPDEAPGGAGPAGP